MKITYRMESGYRLPNLLPTQEPEMHLGKYALLRRKFLKQNRRIMYTTLVTSGKLNAHLMEIERTALMRMEQMTKQMEKEAGVIEELKTTNQMEWVRLKNNIREAAEEVILSDLIYV